MATFTCYGEIVSRYFDVLAFSNVTPDGEQRKVIKKILKSAFVPEIRDIFKNQVNEKLRNEHLTSSIGDVKMSFSTEGGKFYAGFKFILTSGSRRTDKVIGVLSDYIEAQIADGFAEGYWFGAADGRKFCFCFS